MTIEESEPDETFTVRLTNPTGATLGDATAIGTIRDDGDTAATLTASDIEDTTATLTIGGHTDGWWYKGNRELVPGKGKRQECASMHGGHCRHHGGEYGRPHDSNATYKYCGVQRQLLAARDWPKTKFSTLASEGTPTVSISDAQGLEGS